MMKTMFAAALALSFGFGPGSAIEAAEYNKRPHLPPSAQVKVNNTRANLFVVQDQLDRQGERAKRAGQICQDPSTGVVVDRTNPRRETIIATKDIVNLGGHLELRGTCR